MSEQLERIKARRKAHRGVVTKLVNEVTPLIEGERTEKVLIRLKTIEEQLAEKTRTLKNLDEEVLRLIDVLEIENDVLESETVLDKIAQLHGEINAFSKKPTKLADEPPSDHVSPEVADEPVITDRPSSRNSTNHEEIQSENGDTHSRISGMKPKLPKLYLPKFSGDITKFQTFWDSFESAVHLNPELSSTDKFNYLKALVEGPAASTILGLTLTEANYSAAVALLKERYGKKQQIISAHMEELLNLPSCNGDKAIQIRLVYDKISVNVRGLEALGVGQEQYGSLLIPVIMAKLPSNIRLQIARITKRDVWHMDELLRVVKEEVEARELSESMKICESRGPDNPPRRPTLPTASALLIQDSNANRKPQCVYCKVEHYSASCETVNAVPSRIEILKKGGRCFICLASGHRAAQCNSSKRCRKCGKRHHQSICDQNPAAKETGTNTERSSSQDATVAVSRSKAQILLQTARTYAYTADNELIPVRILMDVGSQRSYLSNALKTRLKLKPLRQEHLTLNTFGNEQFNKRRCDLITVRLQAKHGEEVKISALSFPAICSPLQVPVELDKYPHLQDLDLADASSPEQSSDVDMLIGSDYYWDVITGDLKRSGNGPVAVSSKFGWLLSGPVKSKRSEDGYTVTNLVIEGLRKVELISEQHTDENDLELEEELRLFWDTEAIGITEEAIGSPSQQCFVNLKFNWKQGRYQVSLPWKADYRPQNNGYEMCMARLNQLKIKLQRDQSLFQEYHSVLMTQLQDGIIELVPNHKDGNYSHFLPHHGVRKQDRDTTKLRIVFDASAKISRASLSLNDCLEKGPNGTPHLFDILLKFRSNPIGLVADIEKAFHQIAIEQKDRDALRFLWFNDITKTKPEIVQYRFCRLVFGLTPSPAILNETIQQHLTRYLLKEPEMAKLLCQSFYVDDLISGAQDEESGFHTFQRAKELMLNGGFNLQKWRTNSTDLQQKIDQSCNKVSDQKCKVEGVKILGMNWDTKQDKFYFNFEDINAFADSLPPTKRSVLKASAKFFDPIGLLSPVIIGVKILFQMLCKEGKSWDQELEGPLLTKWKQFVRDLEALSQIRVLRYYHIHQHTPITLQIHGFSDASERAYAAVVYLRTV